MLPHSARVTTSHTSVAATQHSRRLGGLIALASVFAIAFATLAPVPGVVDTSPFCVVCGTAGGVDAILNVLLYLPLGVGLAVYGVRPLPALVAMCGLSAAIELTQLFFIPGRDATLGDLLTNTLGAAIGFAIGRYSPVWLVPDRRAAEKLALGWAVLWLGVQAVSSLAFTASFPDSRYYGQIARSFADLATFRGQVIGANIGSTPVPDVAFANSQIVRDLLNQKSYIGATVIPAGRTPSIAPIVRVADAEQREIVLLAQRGNDLVFGVRCMAAVLRLRPPLFALRAVFPDTGGAGGRAESDAFRLRYDEHNVDMQVAGNFRSISRRIPIHPSLGWTLALPFQWYIDGSALEALLSGIWIAGFLLPFGYWAGQVSRGPDEHKLAGRSRLLALTAAMLMTGMIVVPQLFGLSGDTPLDWIAAFVGLAAGYGIACAARTKLNPAESQQPI